ncbi:MAG: hypothetical protein F4Y02_09080 [Chloroflexi bacterium]|nr:hypothetical protein [Chloroflexota bacterium]
MAHPQSTDHAANAEAMGLGSVAAADREMDRARQPGMTLDGQPIRSPKADALAQLDAASRQLETAKRVYYKSERLPHPVILEVVSAIEELHRALRAVVEMADAA